MFPYLQPWIRVTSAPEPFDHALDLLGTVLAADEGRVRGVDDDQIITTDGRDQVAGVVISYIEPSGGYIAGLAVRHPWRRRGLGKLLLLTAFSALRERGCDTATLGVDAGNESGAVGLYEGLGMHEVLVHDFYEKTLRDGA